jgi:hypothetical protein
MMVFNQLLNSQHLLINGFSSFFYPLTFGSSLRQLRQPHLIFAFVLHHQLPDTVAVASC